MLKDEGEEDQGYALELPVAQYALSQGRSCVIWLRTCPKTRGSRFRVRAARGRAQPVTALHFSPPPGSYATLSRFMKTFNLLTSPVVPARQILLFGLAFLALVSANAAEPAPLLHAHAHNDYLHARPLLDALDHGFCSVEADIYLVDGKLLVAHDRNKVQAGRTLQALYLDPLLQRVRQNQGRVFAGGPQFTLLIDLKTDWTNIYPVLRATLTNYASMLTTFGEGVIRSNAVTVIVTGNRSREIFAGEPVRFAALDGDLKDIDSDEPAALIPWISSNWSVTFMWRGIGEIPEPEKARLTDLVARTHRHGRQLRFWGAPDKPAFWQVIRQAGVDLVNTDDLAGLEKFLRDN